MKSAKTVPLLFAALILSLILAPHIAQAADIIVSKDANCSSSSTPPCYNTIQAAIDAASSGNTILVEPDSYSETITLNANMLTILGRETARTFLNSSVTASTGLSRISNMTFTGQAVAITVPSGAYLNIYNNIFWENTLAVQIASASTSIVNNVFFNNITALSTEVDVAITNNIFMSTNSDTAVSSSLSSLSLLTYNDFYGNLDDNMWSPVGNAYNNIADAPPFVDTLTTFDFHLSSAFPGSSGDMGAYGGSYSDTIPFMVTVHDPPTATTDSITVSWDANNSYLVKGYNVYYGTTSITTNATGTYDKSVYVDGAATTTATISGLSTAATVTPEVPALNDATVANQTLNLSWTAVSGATGYRIYCELYDKATSSTSPPSTYPTTYIPVDGGDTTSYPLTALADGTQLINGEWYKIAITAISQATYYIAVTALNSGGGSYSPGTSYESAYSTEVNVGLGDTKESDLSNVIIDFPEALVAYPNLTSVHKGCFIATAAYGYYSAPEVQALRDFRDRFLLTNSLGSAFVSWYYKHGPIAAEYLNTHPGYKPVVRAALMPAVGAAMFMTRTSLLIKGAVLLMLGLAAGLFIVRKKITILGGRR